MAEKTADFLRSIGIPGAKTLQKDIPPLTRSNTSAPSASAPVFPIDVAVPVVRFTE